ncbi:ovarian-specific serine/threonine-protein kinase Lok-like [Anthonomus grandis grandis]|uniref:ovarian-specific serine/threonine-protein kinase Lok-like n=1 Tax=Anthonomus grandis grandis TaxID=2921223 RepID=UPI00216527F0|nr:ovarian-specific serine/threonine-protein kinase Lok-like [Anthonomus grandis grandis]
MILDEMSDDLPNTLTPREEESAGEFITPTTPVQLPWARLISYKPYLRSIDVIGECFTFGRSKDCTVMVCSRNNFPREFLVSISKVHFKMEKSPEDGLVYIIDLSKNGTYINKELIGIRHKRILKNMDEISLGGTASRHVFYKFLTQGDETKDDFLPAELAGKFAKVRQLGKGACGEVCLVKDRNTFQEYAIKKIHLAESHTSLLYKINHPNKVRNEIEILKSISHPFIIKMFNRLQSERVEYMVLEYMRGGELTARILKNNGPMSESLAKFYFLQMTRAISYLHSHRIIHRDLKPENILLLDERDKTILKIADFGLSKNTIDDMAITMCGTLKYVAPEVICPQFREYDCIEETNIYGPKVDVWSLGVILYYMITQELPFNGRQEKELATKILHCKYDLSKGVWKDGQKNTLKHLIGKMLVLRPQHRYHLEDVVRHPWIHLDKEVQADLELLLDEEGLEDPMQELTLGPPTKKLRLDDGSSSSSSSCLSLGSSSEDLCRISTANRNANSCPTLCYREET